jgi:hypothetical protein
MSETFHSFQSDYPCPRECLDHAERYAIGIRKLLAKGQHRLRGTGVGGAMDDAFRIIGAIEQFCSYGRRCDAEDAVEIADYIETLVLMLQREIDEILAFLK